MVLVAMLHHREDPEKVKRAYAFAAVAKAEGIDFFYFSPGKVNMEKQSILGRVYESGKWKKRDFPFPDVIYNASAPMTAKTEGIVDYLYERIPITSHPIGDKLSVYKRILKAKEFAPYLIPSTPLKEMLTLMENIECYSKVIIKPETGNQGGGILFIEKSGKEYKVNEKGIITEMSNSKLVELIEGKIAEEDYLVQPFITCKTKSGHVFDFRLHVQKNGRGEWVITAIYPRIGKLGSVTSNMGSGGYTAYTENFLQSEFDEKWFDVYQRLKMFALTFPKHFDTLYENRSFDELGIDVGIDEDLKLWLFEVNWRPGSPMIFNIELDVVKNTLHYAKYLASVSK